jgi:hypothetical protein
LDTYKLAEIQNETGGQLPMEKFTLNTAINELRNIRNKTITTWKILDYRGIGSMVIGVIVALAFIAFGCFYKDAIGEVTQRHPPTHHPSSNQVHRTNGNRNSTNHRNQPHPTTPISEQPRKSSNRTKQLSTKTKHNTRHRQRPVGGNKEGRNREKATKNLTTSRERLRRPRTRQDTEKSKE